PNARKESSAAIGSNTITLNALSEATYSNCTIKVTDTFGNVSETLTISPFEIDTTAPTVSEVTAVTDPTNNQTPEYVFSSNEAGTITFQGLCSSSTTSAVASSNTIALTNTSLGNLAEDNYTECKVKVTDAAGNVSSWIEISSFEIDTDAPDLEVVTPVKTPTNDTTPNYSFRSTQSGRVVYGGPCKADNASITASDNITITLEGSDDSPLAEDNYSTCTITVIDNASNSSQTLTISLFEIDTTAPTVTSTSPSNTDNNSSVSSSISVTFSEAMDNISTNTNTSCDKTLQLSSNNFVACIPMSSSTPSSNSDNTTFTLAPSDNLSFYTTYKIKVTTSARDLAGNGLASDNETATGFGTRYWTMQIGTSSAEEGRGVDNDSSSNIYVTGGTYGGLDGNTSSGGQDIFLVKIDNATVKHWTRQLGSSSNDTGRGVAVGSSNNIYVTGITAGGLDGYTNLGEQDIFLVKYDSSGTKQWTRQLGTSRSDIAHGVAVHSNSSIYVTGETRGGLDNNTNFGDKDIFLVKYNSSGTRQWTQQLGTASEDVGYGVALNSAGEIFVTGATYGALTDDNNSGSSDIFLVKYNDAGARLWTKQLGTASEDVAYGLTVDSNGIYVTGYTKGSPWNLTGNPDNETNLGNTDAFLLKHYDNSSQTPHWTILLGTSSAEVGRSVTVDSNNLYLTGDNSSTSGDYDAFLAKYSSSGSPSNSPTWVRYMNTSSGEYGYGVVVNSDLNIYAVGNTGGELDNNTNSGLQDVFIFKYNSSGTKQ
ncbi:SBBP repeat-containing protein, partial [Deltaproteobacteria bacterium]|nr:SBBP repeat-containing protein [Deltaproteobacteria bacterium]